MAITGPVKGRRQGTACKRCESLPGLVTLVSVTWAKGSRPTRGIYQGYSFEPKEDADWGNQLWADLQQAHFPRVIHGFHAAVHVEFTVDVLEVFLYRLD